MKRPIAGFLSIVLLLSCLGCQRRKIENPVSFYYIRQDYGYGADGVIAQEKVSGTHLTAVHSMLSAYLQGPSDPSLISLIPSGTFLHQSQIRDGALTVTLSDSISALSGVDLSLACCALAKTAMEFCQVEVVQIRAISTLLDGEESITILAGDILLYDDYTAATDAAQ